jgi:Alanine dehydrogenase/PNT, N-terminal domain
MVALLVGLLLVSPSACWGFVAAPHTSLQQVQLAKQSSHVLRFRRSSSTGGFLRSSRSTTSSTSSTSRLLSATAPMESVVIEANVENGRFLGRPIPYEELSIGVLKEVTEGEKRVAQTPESVATLVKKGFHVLVEAGGKHHGNDRDGTSSFFRHIGFLCERKMDVIGSLYLL